MLNNVRLSRQRGVGLIELMVGMVVALIVVAGASALYLNTSQGSINSQRQIRLNEEVRTVTDIIIQDVRRSGYWSNAFTAGSGVSNPYTSRTSGSATDLYLTSNCWLYSYDATFNGSHTANSTDGYAFYGFRLNNGTIQILPDNSGLADTSSSCANLGWQNLTDSSVVSVTNMTAQISYLCQNNSGNPYIPATAGTTCTGSGDVEVRTFTITITAVNPTDNSITATVTDSVTLPNNRIVP